MAPPFEGRTTTSAEERDGSGQSALAPSIRPRKSTIQPYQRLADADKGTGGESLANFLGLFSIGLGLAQVAMPGAMSNVVGVKDDDQHRMLMRLLGLREISHGVAVLSNQQPEKPMWSRVAGDVLDLALLGGALANSDNDRGRTLFATANVLAVTALDVMAAKTLSKQPDTPVHQAADHGIVHTRKAITVGAPVEAVYAFWRDFENFPRFMRHLESVTDMGNGRSHWVAKAPAGKSVEWDAEITDERENELIAWASLEGSDVYNAGTVRFRAAPKDYGTEIRVDLEYKPPFGKIGSKLAMMFREEPGQQTEDSLRQFKQLMEIGDVVVSDATRAKGPHSAQPN
ncbi:MAG TPA: SRPBCC family protein [Gemmatimonadaceae bacterium]|nr:SRPBCC family protein [Gemmatimonadaceae bacterium]